ncbi:MAG: hypothetical protein ACTSXD_12425, partial [Candidatus Heimdallarchaeaceae archaeon]
EYICTTKEFKTNDYWNNEKWALFFFIFAQLLSVKFNIGEIEGYMIKKEEFEKSFKNTLNKLE